MGWKDVLVVLDRRNPDSRMETALSFARRFGGTVTALYGFELPPAPVASLNLADAIYPVSAAARETYERDRDSAFDDAAQLEAAFHRECKHAGVVGNWQTWPEKPKELIDLVIAEARCADVTVLGQADPAHPWFDTLATLPETVMLGCGRPVVVVPYRGRVDAIGKNALIAWNGSREAARAVADAMPLLEAAKAVTVLSIGGAEFEDAGERQLARVVRHLAQHGVRAEPSHLQGHGIDPADLLLSRCADLGCDLLVMGGYGHSRTREMILGGVTRAILSDMTLPVLMSH